MLNEGGITMIMESLEVRLDKESFDVMFASDRLELEVPFGRDKDPLEEVF